MKNLVMEIKDYKSINEAKIEINKINVVGGVNGSGKSTVSRILYSFLKANSLHRKGSILKIIVDRINNVIDTLNLTGDEYILPKLSIENDFSDIIMTVNNLLEISMPRNDFQLIKDKQSRKKLKKEIYFSKVYPSCLAIYSDIDEFFGVDSPLLSEKIFNHLLLKEHVPVGFKKNSDLTMIIYRINKVIDLLNNKNNDYIVPYHLTLKDDFPKILRNLNFLLKISETHEKIANAKINELMEKIETKFDEIITCLDNDGIGTFFLRSAFNSVNDGDYTDALYILFNIIADENLDYWDYYSEFEQLCEQYSYFYSTVDSHSLCSAINSVIHEFFSEDILSSKMTIKEILSKDMQFDSNVSFYMMPQCENGFYHFFKNFINNVYYVDNVSILDYPDNSSDNYLFHMNEIIGDLFVEYGQNYEISEESETILEKIDEILKGRYDNNTPMFVSDKKNDALDHVRHYAKNVRTSNTDTPSGIKQIGIIQLLLLNGKLEKDGYLIIDEPEVNLHPDWQYKFAEILVLLAKDLNITIYLNSHSPFFIEAIDAFAEFYDMQNDVNYYLSEFNGAGKYDFNKIESDELYKIYDNLGDAYDLIDQLRLEKHLGE